MPISNRKSLALLLYLILNGHAQRETLGELLWSRFDRPQRQASVRKALNDLRRSLGNRKLIQNLGKHSLSLVSETIISEFSHNPMGLPQTRNILQRSGLPDFFVGLDGLDPEYDDWLYQTRNSARSEVVVLLENQIRDEMLAQGDHDLLRLSDFLRKLDPYNELAARTIIETEVNRGNVAQAAKEFLSYRKLLEDDLQVGPPFELSELIAVSEDSGNQSSLRQHILGEGEWFRSSVVLDLEKLATELNPLSGKVATLEGPSGVGKTFTVDRLLKSAVFATYRAVRLSGNDYAGGTEATFLYKLAQRIASTTTEDDKNSGRDEIPRLSASETATHRVQSASVEPELTITGSVSLDEQILLAVQGSALVIHLDDVHRLSTTQQHCLIKVLSLCRNSNCFLILSGQHVGERLKGLVDRSFRLSPLNRDEVRDFILKTSGVDHDPDYVVEVAMSSLGLPMLIQRVIDRADHRVKARLPRAFQRDAKRSLGTIDWSCIDEVLLALSQQERQLLGRVISLGGRISTRRYQEVFGEVRVNLDGVLLDYRIIDEDTLRTRASVEVSHELVALRSLVTFADSNLQDHALEQAIPTLQREEVSGLCRSIEQANGLQYFVRQHRPIIHRLKQLEMWQEIVSLVEQFRGHVELPRWVEDSFLLSLARVQRHVSLVREFTPSVSEEQERLEEVYARACAFVGNTPKFGVRPHFTSDFYRGNFKHLASALIDSDDFEAHGYRAMSLAQLGNFKAAREAVSGALRLASHGENADIQMAEFFRQYVLTHQGDLSGAVMSIRRSLLSLDPERNKFEHSLLLIHLGFVLVLLGRPEAGLRTLETLYETLAESETGVLAGYAETALTSAYLSTNRQEEALIMAERSLKTSKDFRLKSVEVWARRNIFRCTGTADTLHYLQQAIQLAEQLGMVPDLTHLLRLSGHYQISIGEADLGRAQIEKAKQAYLDLGMIGGFSQAEDISKQRANK